MKRSWNARAKISCKHVGAISKQLRRLVQVPVGMVVLVLRLPASALGLGRCVLVLFLFGKTHCTSCSRESSCHTRVTLSISCKYVIAILKMLRFKSREIAVVALPGVCMFRIHVTWHDSLHTMLSWNLVKHSCNLVQSSRCCGAPGQHIVTRGALVWLVQRFRANTQVRFAKTCVSLCKLACY